MSFPLPPVTGDEDKAAAAREQEDQQELESFCRAVKLDEISFEQWRATHSDLDVCLPLFLTEEEAFHGVVKEVKWSKALPADPASKTKECKRVRMSRLITIEAHTAHGTRLLIPNEGDQAQGKTGNLIMTVCVKPPPQK